MQRSESLLTREPLVSPSGVRSRWSSEQGPQGPVSPIFQKLSSTLPLTMWMVGSSPALVNSVAQRSYASWSKMDGSPAVLSGL